MAKKWIEDVEIALTRLGGQGHLSEIYPIVRELRTARNDPIGKLEEWTRNALQQNSRGKGKNLFDSVYPVEQRKGIWRIK